MYPVLLARFEARSCDLELDRVEVGSLVYVTPLAKVTTHCSFAIPGACEGFVRLVRLEN